MEKTKKMIIKSLSVMLAVVLTLTAAPLSGLVGLELPEWLDFSVMSDAYDDWDYDYYYYCPDGQPHELKWVFWEVPTCYMPGYEHLDCIRCGYEDVGGNYLDPIPHDYVDGYCIHCGKEICYGYGEFSTWEYDESNGILTISGTGEMYSWDDNEYTLWECFKDDIKTIIVNKGVTTIGDCAFAHCDSLTGVTIPDSVTTIGISAFYDCDSLTSVTIPDSVTTIGDYAFEYCKSLTSVTIPDSVITIGRYAFAYCTSLTSVTIGDSVTTIGNYAFYSCDSLTDVYYGGTEEQWKKISIGSNNGDLKSATIHYNSTGGNTEPKPDYAIITGDMLFANDNTWNTVKSYKYSYSDEFFTRNSSKYHHDLALMSMAFEASACVPKGGWKVTENELNGNIEYICTKNGDDYSEKKPANAYELLNKIKFDNIEDYGYNIKPEFDSVACVIGSKNINDNTTVIAIAVRGSGYEAEWGGNFRMGMNSTNHEGFNIAKSQVLVNIEEFVREYSGNFNSNVKVWITGYSRGAAIANLVAADLNNGLGGKDTQNLNISKDDIYGYFFETPKNTTDSQANSSKYNNLFSIVNPIDPVPYLAPGNEGFDFKRYGVTYFTPAAETTSGYNGKNGIKAQMSDIHEQIFGTKYEEDFTYYSFDSLDLFKKNPNMGQTTYIHNLVFSLAKTGFKNRENYYYNMQDAMIKIMAMLKGGYGTVDKDGLIEQISLVIESHVLLFTTGGAIGKITALTTLKYDVASVLEDNTELTFAEAYEILGELDSVLLAFISNPNLTYTTIKNYNTIFEPHYFDVLVGWMVYLDTVPEAQREKLMSTELKLKTFKTNCPVDVNVYDEDGTLVASIINDEVVSLDNSLSTYIDENGQKCVVLPYDAEYRVEITAREDCEVTCSVLESNAETGDDERVINYYNMEVDEGESISCIAKEQNGNSECEYIMTDVDENVIDADETFEDDEISYYTVNAESNADEISVLGSGEFIRGEFAQVTAMNIEGYEFVGWYINNELVTSDYQYRFCVVNDVTITAKYEKTPDKPVYNYTFYIQQPSRAEIRNKDGIILHANVEGNAPNGFYVKWESSNGNFDEDVDGNKLEIIAKDKGYTTFTAILYAEDGTELARDSVEMYSKSGFFDKIGGFFRSLFGTTKIYSK